MHQHEYILSVNMCINKELIYIEMRTFVHAHPLYIRKSIHRGPWVKLLT